jgi:predicted enzyme related to lactoylglutathione lyase
MRAQINAITIAANDLGLLKSFYYKTFGWDIQAESEEFVIFRLKNGLAFTIYQQQQYSRYINRQDQMGDSLPKTYLTINTNSLKETDEIFMELEIKQVNIIRKPSQVFWGGYSGIITDPENNYWEISYNPME